MNILIRIKNRSDVVQVEESLRLLPLDLYFVRDDQHMLSILEQSSFDAVLLGFSTDRKTLAESIRRLREHEIDATIPVLLCFGDEWGLERSPSIDRSTDSDNTGQPLTLDFILFKSALETCYITEALCEASIKPLVSMSNS